MPTDALSIAHAALTKASEAMAQIAAHERECTRRYEQTAAEHTRQHMENVRTLQEMDSKVDALLCQANIAKGERVANSRLFASFPGAFWNFMLSLFAVGIGAVASILFLKGHM